MRHFVVLDTHSTAQLKGEHVCK